MKDLVPPLLTSIEWAKIIKRLLEWDDDYRVQNRVWWYCFSWTKENCEKYLKEKKIWKGWSVVKYKPYTHIEKKIESISKKKKKKYSWQDTADIIERKIKFFNIKDIKWKELKKLLWDWTPSWVYWIYEAIMEDWTKFLIWARFWDNQWFKPNADDINYFFPWYKNICRKRIK